MLKNYLKIAFRNFRKNSSFSFINMLGLTIGLGSCLLIALYIRHELSFDRWQTKGDRIVRMIMEYRFDGGGASNKGNYTSTKVAPTFKRTFPEVESAVRMTENSRVVGVGNKLFTEKYCMYADSSFFDLFDFRILKGDPKTALSGLNKVLLTRSTAKKYFGDSDPVGRSILVGTNSTVYTVTGIMEDCPSNSQIRYDLLASFSSLGANQEDSYWDANYTTYLLLHDRSDIARLQAKIHPFMQKEMKGSGASVDFWLEPFDWIHLHSEYAGFVPNTSLTYIYILSAITLLILVIACSTYINLSTARSLERAREVGIRKVVGAGKFQLFWQFIGESAIVCLLSATLSLVIAFFVLPAFSQLAGQQLPASELFSLPMLAIFLLVAIAVSLAAGSYPALILSRFQPVKVLKGSFKNTRSGRGLRRSLIVFQFAISVFLIVSTFIVQRQLDYIRNTQPGFDRSQVIALPMSQKMVPHMDAIKTEFRSDPNVLDVSVCESSPVSIQGGYNMSKTANGNDQYTVFGNPIDEDYIRTTGLQLIAGSDLSHQDVLDASWGDTIHKNYFHFILNESAARQLGWSPQQAIGQRMFMSESRPGIVKGVVKDFHFASFREGIRPVVLFPNAYGYMILARLSGRNLSATLGGLQTKWKQMVPYLPFEYRWLDEDFNRMYTADLRLGKVMNIFALIAIVLACLGLFGLSSYAARQRVKEIGIRKVLGASPGHLVAILSADFVLLSGISICIAFPLAWWTMHKWLQDYAYRTTMGWDIFLLAALLTVGITLLTVSIRAIYTARLNPVKNLRSE